MGRKNLRSGLVALLCVAGCVGALASCVGEPVEDRPIPYLPPVTDEELPVIGAYIGTWDGENLTFQGVDEYLGEIAEERGVAVEELVDLSAMSFGSTGSGTGTNYIALEQVASTRRTRTNGVNGTNGWGPDTECGGTPTTGVCVQVRARNMYTNQVERVYVELTQLNPTGATTAVNVPVPGANAWTGVDDYDLVLPVTNGLWRYGTIGRSSPVGGGVPLRWAFHGTTTGTFTFTFIARVRGLIVNETRRASLANLVSDSPQAGYPDQGGSEGTSIGTSAVSVSSDGRYVVFATNSAALLGGFGATGQQIVRRDMQTGAVELVSRTDAGAAPTGTCLAANPHISGTGAVVVFTAQGTGCALVGGMTSTFPQVYVRDMFGERTLLVSADSSSAFLNQASLNPRISADGTTVVFESAATNVDGHPGGRSGCREIYRHVIDSGAPLGHVSVLRDANYYDPSDGWAPGCSTTLLPGFNADVSSDGNLVLFVSRLQLEGSDPDTSSDIYVYNEGASLGGNVLVYRVSQTSAGAAFAGGTVAGTNHPTISADGSTIAFSTDHSNLVSGTTGGRRHVYTRTSDEGAAAFTLVSAPVVGGEAATDGPTPWPSLSADGRFVAFWSAATTLASPYNVSSNQVYVCDTRATHATLVRCWLASMAQLSASASFTNFGGTAATTQRIGFAMASDNDVGYVVYQGNPNSWGGMNGPGTQVFMSPVGDPRFQQQGSGVVPGP